MAGLCLWRRHRPDCHVEIRHPRPARVLRERPALAAPLWIQRAASADAAWWAVRLGWKRRDRLSALREFEGQDHDWVEVHYTTKSRPEDQRRQSAFKYLADRGLVERQNGRKFDDGGGLPKDNQGRLISSEIIYRITALGRDELTPWYMKFLTNVSSNFPTVITSVAIALLSAWLLSSLGPDGSAFVQTNSDTLEVED